MSGSWFVDLDDGPCPVIAFYDRAGNVIEPKTLDEAHGFKAMSRGREVWSLVRAKLPGVRDYRIWRETDPA